MWIKRPKSFWAEKVHCYVDNKSWVTLGSLATPFMSGRTLGSGVRAEERSCQVHGPGSRVWAFFHQESLFKLSPSAARRSPGAALKAAPGLLWMNFISKLLASLAKPAAWPRAGAPGPYSTSHVRGARAPRSCL